MANDAKARSKALEASTLALIEKAPPEQLLQLAADTTLAREPLVGNFQKAPADEQKTADLRKLIYQSARRQADLRGLLVRKASRLGLVQEPVKEKKEAAAAPPPKAKKEKGEKHEKGEKKEKGEKHEKGEKAAPPA